VSPFKQVPMDVADPGVSPSRDPITQRASVCRSSFFSQSLRNVRVLSVFRPKCRIILHLSILLYWYTVQGIHQHATHITEWAAQLINTAKQQQKDRTKQNVKWIIIIMTFVKWYWQAYNAMDLSLLINCVAWRWPYSAETCNQHFKT
jgi:hypothetical protein